MSLPEPATPPLQTLDETINKLNKLAGLLSEFEETLKIKRFIYNPIEPSEEVALKRARELVTILGILEKGEEKIAVDVIHELKYIFKIIGGRKCNVCGVNWKPYKYILRFICPSCGRKWLEVEASSKLELDLYRKLIYSKPRVVVGGKAYGPLFCGRCILMTLKDIGKCVRQPLVEKVVFESRQYSIVPEAIALVILTCKNCGFKRKRWFPVWMPPHREKYEVTIDYIDEYRRFMGGACPRCNSDEAKAEVKYIDVNRVTEDIRVEWGIPIFKRGEEITVPSGAGVRKRYYYKLIKLREELKIGRVDLELTAKIELTKLLDYYEENIYNWEVLQDLYEELRTYINSIKDVLSLHRSIIMEPPPSTVVVDGNKLIEIIEVANEIIGMCDIIFKTYLPDTFSQYGHELMLQYMQFKVIVKELMDLCGHININVVTQGARPEVVKTVEVRLDPLIERIEKLRVTIPNIRGLITQIKGVICDTLFVDKRKLELMLMRLRVLSRVQPSTLEISPPTTKEKVIATMSLQPEREFTVRELVELTGAKVQAVENALRDLARRGIVKKVGAGYKLVV